MLSTASDHRHTMFAAPISVYYVDVGLSDSVLLVVGSPLLVVVARVLHSDTELPWSRARAVRVGARSAARSWGEALADQELSQSDSLSAACTVLRGAVNCDDRENSRGNAPIVQRGVGYDLRKYRVLPPSRPSFFIH